jgi:hypothetical protein
LKRVFLSFAAEDMNFVRGLRLMSANEDFPLEFFDESVRREIQSQNDAYIRSRIREKINRTSVTVCLIGLTTARSSWVAWELEESANKGNTIIAMAVKGLVSPTPPAYIAQRFITVHAWDPTRLATLLEHA